MLTKRETKSGEGPEARKSQFRLVEEGGDDETYAFDPIEVIALGGGPMKTIPLSARS